MRVALLKLSCSERVTWSCARGDFCSVAFGMRGFSERWAPSRRSCDTMSGMANHEKRRQEDAKKKAKSNTRAKSGAGSKNAGRSHAARRAGASDSPCPVDARCGGCKNLCVPYTKQLIDKQLRIERLFAPLAPDGTISLIKGMKDPYHYRNKVISPFAPGKKLPPGRIARRPTPAIARRRMSAARKAARESAPRLATRSSPACTPRDRMSWCLRTNA